MNPLVNRIWSSWTNSSQQELLAMLGEFRLDYMFDDSFLHGLDIIEEAILQENYERALVIFQEMKPSGVFLPRDFDLFVEILDEANYGY
tara:strand:- start:5254 stop:5520 length:267 start_codon:yes stop_codon:yes gene_type:complete